MAKSNHCGSFLPTQKQGRHFALWRKTAETEQIIYGIMIAKAGFHFVAEKQRQPTSVIWPFNFE